MVTKRTSSSNHLLNNILRLMYVRRFFRCTWMYLHYIEKKRYWRKGNPEKSKIVCHNNSLNRKETKRLRTVTIKRNLIHKNMFNNDSRILNFESSLTTSNYFDWIKQIINYIKFTPFIWLICNKNRLACINSKKLKRK